MTHTHCMACGKRLTSKTDRACGECRACREGG